MTPSITWEPPSTPRKPAGTSTLLDCLWPQENRNVVALTWALLIRRLQTSRPIFQTERLSQSNLRACVWAQPHLDGVRSGPRPWDVPFPSSPAGRVPRVSQTVFLPRVMPSPKGQEENRESRRFGELAVRGKAIPFPFRTEGLTAASCPVSLALLSPSPCGLSRTEL